jgi:hypothetical protein
VGGPWGTVSSLSSVPKQAFSEVFISAFAQRPVSHGRALMTRFFSF